MPGVGGLYPALWALMSAFTSRPPVLHILRYADVLPDYMVAFDGIDALLRDLEEHQSRIEGLLEE